MTLLLRMGMLQRGAAFPCPPFPCLCSQEASRLEKEYEASLAKSAEEENLSLQKLIKAITEVSMQLRPHSCKFGLKVLEEGDRQAQGLDLCCKLCYLLLPVSFLYHFSDIKPV